MIRKRDDIFRLHWIGGGTTLHPLHVAFRPDNRLRRCGPSTRQVGADNTTVTGIDTWGGNGKTDTFLSR
ncbi:MAG: hypothetical protein ACFN1B_08490 [Prevotella denticola]